jgi:hypothetical protein
MSKALYLLAVPHGPSVVVRAACVVCARGVAADNAGPEGTAVWRDPSRSTCKQIDPSGKSGLVLRRD